MLRSRPVSLAFPAGTISSSAERKSSSSMPYFSLRSFRIPALTASFSFLPAVSSAFLHSHALFSALHAAFLPSARGLEPIKTSSFSPSITVAACFFICSAARCGRRSVTLTTGSFSSSPITTSTSSPSFFATTPCIARGRATH